MARRSTRKLGKKSSNQVINKCVVAMMNDNDDTTAGPSGSSTSNPSTSSNPIGDGAHGTLNIQSALAMALNKRPMYSGKKNEFRIFLIKLENHLLSLNLDDVIKSDIPDPTRNKAVYLEISQMLPDELINLITLNAFGNGKRAYELIVENQEGDKALRVITAITDMQSIKINPNETVATYLGRMDALRQQAKSLDVIPSEEYFVIGVIHGLPEKYTNLKTIVFSGPIPSYDAFKCQLTNYAAQLNMANEKPQTTVMNVNVKPVINKPKENNNYKKLNKNKPKCYKCLKIGHKANECRSKVFCKFCNNKSHHTKDCRNRNNPNKYNGKQNNFNKHARNSDQGYNARNPNFNQHTNRNDRNNNGYNHDNKNSSGHNAAQAYNNRGDYRGNGGGAGGGTGANYDGSSGGGGGYSGGHTSSTSGINANQHF